MSWFSRGLAFRQTVYTMIVVVVLTSALSVIEIVFAYQAENERQARFVQQLGDAFAETAARAAFHVDEAQANAVLEGLMKFDTLAQARISTDLGDVLAERERPVAPDIMDGISNWLFADSTRREQVLTTTTAHVTVGTLVLGVSPALVGSGFARTVAALVAALVIEFVIFASALAIIFHRTLVRPLTKHANDIEAVDHDDVELPQLEVPGGHAHDELGLVIMRTNQLFTRISEQREALVHREKIAALGAMLTGAAHELNNPLAVASAQAQLLRETSDDESIHVRANKILLPVQRCAKIVRSFLELARQRKPEKTPLNIRDVIDDAVELVTYQLEAHGVELDIRCPDDIPVFAGDAMHLSQAVMNLLVNAHQALIDRTPPRKIGIDVSYRDATVTVEVTDNGPGIPSDLRGRVVEPFFTTKSQGRGTGLGLAFCNNVAKEHGGFLQIVDGEACGAIVRLVVAAERTSMPSETSTVARPRHRSLRVLVVDDERALTETIAEALTLQYHQAEVAFGGTAALAILEERAFDIVLADIRMPDMSGIELFEKSTKEQKELIDRFVFMTGEPLTAELGFYMRERGVPCLAKPVDLADLVTVVERRAQRQEDVA